jgi:hypothetical protein
MASLRKKPDQDRREGRQPWPLRHVPDAEVTVPRQIFQDILILITPWRGGSSAKRL